MKKHNLLLSLFILLIFIVSCGDDETEEMESDDQEISCAITKVDYGYYSITLVYDNDGKVTSIIEKEEGEPEETLTLTYSDGKIVSGKYEDETEITVEYTGDKVSKIAYEDLEYDEIDEYRLTYNGDQLATVENWDDYTGEEGVFTLYSTTTFTYTGDNVTEVDEEFELGEEEYKTTYTFDNKLNPFEGDLVFLIWEQNYTLFASANNPLSSSESFRSEPAYTENYTYTFNEQGYPLTNTAVNDDGNMYIESYTYDCQ